MKTLLKIVLLFFLNTSFYLNADAQKPITWQKLFGIDSLIQGTYGIQTSDGGYAILASWSPESIYRGWIRVLKLDKHGNLIWTRNYGVNTFKGMIEDSDSGFVIIGGGGAGSGAALFKINSNGDSILFKSYGGPDFQFIKKYYDGGFILTGRSINDLGYIERLDSNYNTIWSNTYLGINYESISTRDIAFDKNNNIAISLIGYISQNSDGGILKLTPDGNQYKIVFHNTPLVIDNYNYILPVNGKYAVSGTADNQFDSESSVYCILDTNGNLLSRKYYHDIRSVYFHMVNAGSNFIALGGFHWGATFEDFKMGIKKIDFEGNTIWTRIIKNALSVSAPSSMISTSDKGYLLTGNYENIPANTYCIYIIKTDSNAYTEPVGISDEEYMIQEGFVLYQNYPNPFNPETKINYELRIKNYEFVSLKVFDALGKVVAVLVNEKKSPGRYEVKFDGSNLPSGIYFYKLQTEGFSETKRMLLVK